MNFPVAATVPAPVPALQIAEPPEPKGIQKDVVALRPEGQAIVLGAAGSGKSLTAVHRALYLSDPAHAHAGRTLLVTYNKTLLTHLERYIPKDTPNLDVCTYHQFARNYLDEQGKMERGWIVLGSHKFGLVKEALEAIRRQSTDTILKKPTGFFVPELDWIAHNGYMTEESYLTADRGDRGPALTLEQRKAVFQVAEAYWGLRAEMEKHYDWADMPAATHKVLQEDEGMRDYTHIIIDEGQDFSPEMLRSLAIAFPQPGGSLTFFGDAAQQIYSQGNNQRAAGLEMSQVVEMTANHRNSSEIGRLANAIADMPYLNGQPDVVRSSEFGAPGPLPTLVTLAGREAEDAFIAEKAKELAAQGSVAVLYRRDSDANRVGESLGQATHLNKVASTWQPGAGVFYGNIHSAKGYEFESVIIVGVTKSKWPERRILTMHGPEHAAAMDGRLLYVAVTRAKRNLIMTATRPLTTLLPPNQGLWQEEKAAPQKPTLRSAGAQTPAAMPQPMPPAGPGQAPPIAPPLGQPSPLAPPTSPWMPPAASPLAPPASPLAPPPLVPPLGQAPPMVQPSPLMPLDLQQPSVGQPDAIEPAPAEPVAPVSAEPIAAAPVAPEATVPVEPVPAAPEAPALAEPVASVPTPAEPVAAVPVAPEATEPGSAEPEPVSVEPTAVPAEPVAALGEPTDETGVAETAIGPAPIGESIPAVEPVVPAQVADEPKLEGEANAPEIKEPESESTTSEDQPVEAIGPQLAEGIGPAPAAEPIAEAPTEEGPEATPAIDGPAVAEPATAASASEAESPTSATESSLVETAEPEATGLLAGAVEDAKPAEISEQEVTETAAVQESPEIEEAAVEDAGATETEQPKPEILQAALKIEEPAVNGTAEALTSEPEVDLEEPEAEDPEEESIL